MTAKILPFPPQPKARSRSAHDIYLAKLLAIQWRLDPKFADLGERRARKRLSAIQLARFWKNQSRPGGGGDGGRAA
jgi:hypothetical protein